MRLAAHQRLTPPLLPLILETYFDSFLDATMPRKSSPPLPPMTTEAFRRLFAVLGMLREPTTIAGITTRFRVSTRQARRYLVSLRQLGFDIQHQEGDYNRRYFRVMKANETLRALMGGETIRDD